MYSMVIGSLAVLPEPVERRLSTSGYAHRLLCVGVLPVHTVSLTIPSRAH